MDAETDPPMTKSQLKKLKKKRAKERNEQKSAKQPRLDQGVCVEENTTHSSEDETEELQRALESKMEELQRAQKNINELRSSLATEEATAAALATEAASIANTLLQTTTTHSVKWTCEVCKTKQFDSFKDAAEHEKSCTGHTVDDIRTNGANDIHDDIQGIEFEPEVNPLEPLARENPLEPMVNPNPDPNTNPLPNLVLIHDDIQAQIDDLKSSKEHLVLELAESNAKNALLVARLASTTDEIPSNSSKVDDNIS
jgi:hypothetical protein